MKNILLILLICFGFTVFGQSEFVDLSRGINLSQQKIKSERLSAFVDVLQYCIPVEGRSRVMMNVSFETSPKDLEGIDESFRLKIYKDSISVTAKTDVGAGYGIMHLIELAQRDGNYIAPIGDYKSAPKYSWRGLMLDVSRHYINRQVLERNLKAMAFAKLNVLHLHLSDDQSFRMESANYKKLHIEGCEGGFYSQEFLKEFVALGDEYGIRVIPEIDVPGHATSICAAYPHLCSKEMKYQIEHGYGIFDASLNPANDSVYVFIEDLASEVNEVFNDSYMHIGGDENRGLHWVQNNAIQKFMKKHDLKTAEELQAFFNKRLYKILFRNGLKMMGWDEIMSDDLPRDIIIQSWRGKESVYKADSLGFNVVLSKGYYLDKCFTAYEYYQNELPQTKNLLGGEACMWTELVSEQTLESRLWPASLAIGKRLWDGEEVFENEEGFNAWLFSAQDKVMSLGLPLSGNKKMILKELAPKYVSEMSRFLALFSPKTGYARHVVYKNRGIYNDMINLRTFADVLTADDAYASELLRYKNSAFLSKEDRLKYHSKLDEMIALVKKVKRDQVFIELSDSYLDAVVSLLEEEKLPIEKRKKAVASSGVSYSEVHTTIEGIEESLGFYFILQ